MYHDPRQHPNLEAPGLAYSWPSAPSYMANPYTTPITHNVYGHGPHGGYAPYATAPIRIQRVSA